MLSPFKRLKNKVSSSVLGIDIGTTSIKAVEVSGGEKQPVLLNYALLESQGSLLREHSALQTSKLKLFEQEVQELLGTLLERMKPRTTSVVASLPLFSSFTTVVKLPPLSQKDLEQAVLFQARQYIPLPLEEVALDWIEAGEIMDEKGGRHIAVLLISTPHEQIRKYEEIFRAAGLSLRALELESMSVVRAVSHQVEPPTVVVDIGSRSTGISITERGVLRSITQSDFAGSSLTHALASSLNISPLRAEELKRERGIAGMGPNRELSTIMLPFLDAILSEVKRADFNYRTQFPNAAPLAHGVITGGGANLLGIEKYASGVLGIPVEKASPFSRFAYSSAIEPFVPELHALLTVSLGLTLREFKG